MLELPSISVVGAWWLIPEQLTPFFSESLRRYLRDSVPLPLDHVSDLSPTFVPVAILVPQGLGRVQQSVRLGGRRRSIAQRAVGPDVVVSSSVLLRQYLHLPKCVENLPV